jgi:predicted secreted Zn-dependent protease
MVFTQTPWGHKPTNLDLKVYVTLTLPRVKYPGDMPLETRRYFSRQIQAIYNHEYTHRKYKIEFYTQFVWE